MRRRSRLLAAVGASSAMASALVLASPTAVQAAPKSPAPDRPATSSVSAPYTGTAVFESRSRNCDEPEATCTATGGADAATGRSTVAGSYSRRSPISDDGSLFARSVQDVSYAVPRGAKTVTAVLRWRVDSASAAAVAAPGYITALTGVAAALPWDSSCAPPACDAAPQQVQVATTSGPYGVPGPPQGVVGPRTETLTLTASGTLPSTLVVRASAYVIIFASGDYDVCLNWDGCGGPTLSAHAGTADARIDATLLSVEFQAS